MTGPRLPAFMLAAIALAGLALLLRYEVSAVSQHSWLRHDRWTGQVDWCTFEECFPIDR